MSGVARLTVVVAQGNWGTVECAVRVSGKVPAQDFLDKDCEEIREKGKNHPQSTARARFMFLFQQMANYGVENVSHKRFKKEMDRFYAFKHEVKKVQIRFPCFQDGNKWILTHGFIKPGAQKGRGDWPKSEIERAEEIMSEYFQRKKAAADGAAGRGKS
jgi:hypothetical protein